MRRGARRTRRTGRRGRRRPPRRSTSSTLSAASGSRASTSCSSAGTPSRTRACACWSTSRRTRRGETGRSACLASRLIRTTASCTRRPRATRRSAACWPRRRWPGSSATRACSRRRVRRAPRCLRATLAFRSTRGARRGCARTRCWRRRRGSGASRSSTPFGTSGTIRWCCARPCCASRATPTC